jgi:hypothetical protein
MTRSWSCSTKMPLPPITNRTNTRSSAWRSSTQVSVGKELRVIERTDALWMKTARSREQNLN